MIIEKQPNLSVVIVVIKGLEGLREILKAISAEIDGEIEVLVSFDDQHKDVEQITNEQPWVTLVYLPGFHHYAQLRANAVHMAKGNLIAVTEDHCIPGDNWCSLIINSHQLPYPVIGGSVEKLAPDSTINWAVYFADYLRYMSPLPEGPAKSLTDLNVSYKKEALFEIQEIWRNEFHENQVHAELLKINASKWNEKSLWMKPDIVVYQQRNFRFGEIIKDRYSFGRLFASTRVQGLTLLKRLRYCIMAVIVPLLLIVRMSLEIFRKKRFTWQFVKSLPYLLIFSVVWGWGEFIGSLTGKHQSW